MVLGSKGSYLKHVQGLETSKSFWMISVFWGRSFLYSFVMTCKGTSISVAAALKNLRGKMMHLIKNKKDLHKMHQKFSKTLSPEQLLLK